ncbi:MAG TPA: diadenylate cyclase CdaA [Bacteroidia bacterium]|nr:diadenylate cyclase CdaA [Bacteroidia bacterium]
MNQENMLHIGISEIIDITLVAIMLYVLYNLIRGTSAVKVFWGLGIIYIVWVIVTALDFKLLSSIVGKFINLGIITIIIIFQQEIRKFLLLIGSTDFWKKHYSIFKIKEAFKESTTSNVPINILQDACYNLGRTKTGALIVIHQKDDLSLYEQSGVPVNAPVTEYMLESIFYKNAPLHDGAVIIKNNFIISARCILPVSESNTLPSHAGTRHRASLGIAEETDAVAIAVSEQTGSVSICKNGKIYYDIPYKDFIPLLEKLLD